MINLLHTYYPQPNIIEFGEFNISWYGFLIALGAALGLWAVVRLAQRYQIDKDFIYNLTFWGIIFGIIGARVYFVLYDLGYYLSNPLEILMIWQGGLAIHGAIIGGLLTLFFMSRKYQKDAWLIADILVVGLVIGQIIGRWGNYFNQELYGSATNLPWGIPITGREGFFHPTFLYESLLNVIVLIILVLWHRTREGRPNIKTGSIALGYLIMYSTIRIGMELLRTDYSPTVYGLRWALVFSAAVIIISAVILWTRLSRSKT